MALLSTSLPVMAAAPSEGAVGALTHPAVAALLLGLGFLCLLVEIKTPALGFSGPVGLALLAVFAGAHMLAGLAGPVELLLIGGGLVLVGVEVHLTPGLGVAGGLGILSLLAGSVLSMLGPDPTAAGLLAAGAALAAAVLLVWAAGYAYVRHMPHGRSLAAIVLRRGDGSGATYLSPLFRRRRVGRRGVAATDLRPSGTALVGEERLDVVAEGEFLEEGTPVVIVRPEGRRYVVREAGPGERPAARGDER